jgi:hypothetical protein
MRHTLVRTVTDRTAPHAGEAAMRYRRLSSTEVPVSVTGIGTWPFGGE